MLRDDCLPQACGSFQMAYACFRIPDRKQDLDADGLPDQLEQFGQVITSRWMMI